MNLSKRERQILEILYRRGKATVSEVQSDLNDKSSYSAVRGLLRVLSEKKLVNHEQDGVRYVFSPSTPVDEAAKSALDGIVNTFFSGSVAKVVMTLLSESEQEISEAELDRLASLIENARKEK